MTILETLKRLLGLSPERQAGGSPFAPGQGPARLLVMRHAEKTGEKSDSHLSATGHARAEALASYLPQQFGRPDFLIAASNSKKSLRPVETIEPLAQALRLPIDAALDDEDIEELVSRLAGTPAYAGKFGVISWRHASLPGLLAALGAPKGSYPDPWPSDVYDLTFELTYAGGEAPAVRGVPQPF